MKRTPREEIIYQLRMTLALTGAPRLNDSQMIHLAIKVEDFIDERIKEAR